MVYSGRYSIKNHSKYKGDVANIVYRSLWEKAVFMWCDGNPKVKKWSSEEVVVPYYYEVDKKYHRYFVDMKITYDDDKTILVEIKPSNQTVPPVYPGRRTKRYINEGLTYVKNLNKWKAAQNFAADRGYGFQIWTEHTLEKMGILPKSTKPLKPYKRKKRV